MRYYLDYFHGNRYIHLLWVVPFPRQGIMKLGPTSVERQDKNRVLKGMSVLLPSTWLSV